MKSNLNIIDFSLAKYRLKFSEGLRNIKVYFYSADQTPPPEIGKIYNFFILWKNEMEGEKLPSRKDIEFEKFAGWHSNLRIIDNGGCAEAENKYLIVGDNFKNLWGESTLKEIIQSKNPPSEETIKKHAQYQTNLCNHHYSIAFGNLPASTSSFNAVILMEFPLADNGIDVSHYLAAILPIEHLNDDL